ncbi:MAG: helical backbone metal receptor [Synergistaceae bacterium]|jgi:iron complex transport system substrate-binding protein|nr:helical backbone metal receptor [Synergistaceae bacterium]
MSTWLSPAKLGPVAFRANTAGRIFTFSRFSGVFARFILGVFLLFGLLARMAPSQEREGVPRRILSVAPAGTEILYDLGLGDSVVGVTMYCSWPPEAKLKKNVGDMMHLNMEVVVSLNPDLVVISNMNEHLKGSLEMMGYPVAVVYQDNFVQICDSMIRVGEACGVAASARKRVDELRAAVRDISARSSGPPLRVLIVVGRDVDDTSFKKIYVAGVRSFYNDLLKESGVINAFQQDAPYSQISLEGLLRLDPDIVIELVGESGMTNLESSAIMKQWKSLKDLRASRDDRIALIRGDFTLRAGPRYPLILDSFSKVIRDGVREIYE